MKEKKRKLLYIIQKPIHTGTSFTHNRSPSDTVVIEHLQEYFICTAISLSSPREDFSHMKSMKMDRFLSAF